jgi:hypothetical protein
MPLSRGPRQLNHADWNPNLTQEKKAAMKNAAKLAACLVVTLGTVLASAQTSSGVGDAAAPATISPNAYVYVINRLSNSSYELDGYSADSNGALTPIAGSPFWKTSNTLMALANTAHYLFVSDGTFIYTFSIASSGALKQVSSINAEQYYGLGEAGASLVLDHTGSTLYALADDGAGDNEFQFFSKNSSTGALTYLGSTGHGVSYGELTFIGNNVDAYGFACFDDSSFDYGFTRSSSGILAEFNPTFVLPTNPNGDYCAVTAAADPGSDLAVALYLETSTTAFGPPAYLATYTADSSGNLSTKSTYQNMVSSEVGNLNAMAANPAGNLLAVGGSAGLQVFFFNGSNPITAYTGFLAVHPITSLTWDTHNHLYGISSSGKLYAFRVTTTGNKQASGSPYTITDPLAIAVVSK